MIWRLGLNSTTHLHLTYASILAHAFAVLIRARYISFFIVFISANSFVRELSLVVSHGLSNQATWVIFLRLAYCCWTKSSSRWFALFLSFSSSWARAITSWWYSWGGLGQALLTSCDYVLELHSLRCCQLISASCDLWLDQDVQGTKLLRPRPRRYVMLHVRTDAYS